mmetsp:Transcript_23443/g.66348  ORF Transcript_23443/g.66348 Transcript_23443/m.66348 type:complete len:254 (+) Transcript_23443:275-1036(+)
MHGRGIHLCRVGRLALLQENRRREHRSPRELPGTFSVYVAPWFGAARPAPAPQPLAHKAFRHRERAHRGSVVGDGAAQHAALGADVGVVAAGHSQWHWPRLGVQGASGRADIRWGLRCRSSLSLGRIIRRGLRQQPAAAGRRRQRLLRTCPRARRWPWAQAWWWQGHGQVHGRPRSRWLGRSACGPVWCRSAAASAEQEGRTSTAELPTPVRHAAVCAATGTGAVCAASGTSAAIAACLVERRRTSHSCSRRL